MLGTRNVLISDLEVSEKPDRLTATLNLFPSDYHSLIRGIGTNLLARGQ